MADIVANPQGIPDSGSMQPGVLENQVPPMKFEVPPEFRQVIVPPTPPVPGQAPGVPPIGSEPPGMPQDQDALAVANKRIADTQRWAHGEVQRRQQLERALKEVITNPSVIAALEGKTAQEPQAGQVPSPGFEHVKPFLQRYKEAKTEEEAMAILMEAGTAQAMTKVQETLQAKEREQTIVQAQSQAKQAVDMMVEQIAPDVNLQMFWAIAPDVEVNTPPHLTEPSERIQWQIQAGIQRVRQIQTPHVLKAAAYLLQNEQARTKLQALIAPGSNPPVSLMPGSQQARRPMNFVEQMKARQEALFTPKRPGA